MATNDDVKAQAAENHKAAAQHLENIHKADTEHRESLFQQIEQRFAAAEARYSKLDAKLDGVLVKMSQSKWTLAILGGLLLAAVFVGFKLGGG